MLPIQATPDQKQAIRWEMKGRKKDRFLIKLLLTVMPAAAKGSWTSCWRKENIPTMVCTPRPRHVPESQGAKWADPAVRVCGAQGMRVSPSLRPCATSSVPHSTSRAGNPAVPSGALQQEQLGFDSPPAPQGCKVQFCLCLDLTLLH